MHFCQDNLLTIYLHVKCTTIKSIYISKKIISESPNQESDLGCLNTSVL